MRGRRALCCLSLLVLPGCGGDVTGHASPPRSSSPPSTAASTAPTAPSPADLDVNDLQQRWWEWATAEPEETNPVSDATGEDCGRNQSGDLWLVAGSFGEVVERTCTVPASRPLAGPAVNLVSEDPADCDEFMGGANGKVTLDGEDVPLRRVDRADLRFHGVDGNPVLDGVGEFDGYGCGLWFSLAQLTRGGHLLVITGGSVDFSLRVTYHLTATDT